VGGRSHINWINPTLLGIVLSLCGRVFTAAPMGVCLQLAADLEEAQQEVEKLMRQQRKYQQTAQALEEELNGMKTSKRLSIGFDREDYKAEIAK